MTNRHERRAQEAQRPRGPRNPATEARDYVSQIVAQAIQTLPQNTMTLTGVADALSKALGVVAARLDLLTIDVPLTVPVIDSIAKQVVQDYAHASAEYQRLSGKSRKAPVPGGANTPTGNGPEGVRDVPTDAGLQAEAPDK